MSDLWDQISLHVRVKDLQRDTGLHGVLHQENMFIVLKVTVICNPLICLAERFSESAVI